MNLDQLMDSLSGNDPGRDSVLALVERKRRAARRRVYAVTSGLAVVVVAIAGAALFGVSSGTPSAGPLSPATSAVAPYAPGAARPNDQDGGNCPAVPLRDEFTTADHGGASIIVAYGTVGAASTAGGSRYYQVRLGSVRTLAGPAVSSGAAAWVRGTASDGELFAIVTPATPGSAPGGPMLRAAPVVDGQVIFAAGDCWSVAGLPARPYSSPNGGSSQRGLYAVPLAAIEKLAAAVATG